jgi:hypothetical protein
VRALALFKSSSESFTLVNSGGSRACLAVQIPASAARIRNFQVDVPAGIDHQRDARCIVQSGAQPQALEGPYRGCR